MTTTHSDQEAQPVRVPALDAVDDRSPDVPLPVMCSNCNCHPVALTVKCGFDDWCGRCDMALYSTRQYEDLCLANKFPPPPVNPVGYHDGICPCGFFAVRNRHLVKPSNGQLPLHVLVTVPLTANTHITMCLICESVFKHHRNAIQHLRQHHQHYHLHHK
jgi:hypothetical protein